MAADAPRFVTLTSANLADLTDQANALGPEYSPVGRPFVAVVLGAPGFAWAFEGPKKAGWGRAPKMGEGGEE